MQVITTINKQKKALRSKIVSYERKGFLGKIVSTQCRLLLKTLSLTSNVVWNLSLIKTSIQVTRTPLVTVKSILNANLNHARKEDRKKLKLPKLPVAYEMADYQIRTLNNIMLRRNSTI